MSMSDFTSYGQHILQALCGVIHKNKRTAIDAVRLPYEMCLNAVLITSPKDCCRCWKMTKLNRQKLSHHNQPSYCFHRLQQLLQNMLCR